MDRMFKSIFGNSPWRETKEVLRIGEKTYTLTGLTMDQAPNEPSPSFRDSPNGDFTPSHTKPITRIYK